MRWHFSISPNQIGYVLLAGVIGFLLSFIVVVASPEVQALATLTFIALLFAFGEAIIEWFLYALRDIFRMSPSARREKPVRHPAAKVLAFAIMAAIGFAIVLR